MRSKYFFGVIALMMMLFIGSGCNMDYRSKDDGGGSSSTAQEAERLNSILYLKSSDIDVRAELITDKNGDNALTVNNGEHTYSYYRFTKRGSASGDESGYSGSNAAVLARDAANFTLRDSLVFSSGDYAQGVFSLGEGTTATISDCVISTRGPRSSALMTASKGTIAANHVTAETFGNLSPAIYAYRGGGSISAERGKYTTAGAGSPVIRSEGEVNMLNAKLESGVSQAVILNGDSSVTLASCDVTGKHSVQSQGVSSRFQSVLIYNSGSGNPDTQKGIFTMAGGSITNNSGDVFYVTNATAEINLSGVNITNNDLSGALIRVEASEFGTLGVNGGNVQLIAVNQDIDGDIYLDGLSDMNMYLTDESYFTGTINPSGTSARAYVEIVGSRWVLTGDSHIDSLTCEDSSINLNGHKLYVAGELYEQGSDSTGDAIDFISVREITSDDISDVTSQDVTQHDSEDTENPDITTQDPSEDITETESSNKTLSFDVLIYETGTVNGVAYRAYSNRVYVSNPVSEEYQKLSVYIPEPYFSSRNVNGYSASTAPIFIPNDSGGYMAAGIMTPTDTNIIGLALSRGLVVVSPALRGRNVANGTAPAAIVDYKAAVRYIRANRSRLPAGNVDRIISCGVSSGGNLSALLGASGNAGDYEYWLDEIGAADADDNIFASVCYCPVTDLDNADGAYEWVFGGTKYGEASEALISEFESYINSLSLTKDGVELTIYEEDPDDESIQTFRHYINGLYANAAQEAIDSGTAVSADWVNVSGDTVISADIRKYAESFITREKSIPAFDKLDLSSPENSLFDYMHFSYYSSEHSTAGGKLADASIIIAMNPLEFLDYSDKAKFWRIRHGVNDRDITLTVPAVLALRLENSGCNVDFKAVWGQGHGGYYDTAELFGWIDSICK